MNDGTNVGKVLPKPPLGTKAGAEGTNSFAATLRKGLTGAGAGASAEGPPGTKSGVLTLRPLMLQQMARKLVLGELRKGAPGDEGRLRQRGRGKAALRDEASSSCTLSEGHEKIDGCRGTGEDGVCAKDEFYSSMKLGCNLNRYFCCEVSPSCI